MNLQHFIFRKLLKRMLYKPMSIAELHAQQAKSAKMLARLPKSIAVETVEIDRIHAEWITHESADAEKVILYLHGGGYVAGTLDGYRLLCATLSAATRMRVLLPEYRLAPDYPFPAALEDALSVYAWLGQNGFSAENIIIAGDSAGGGLTLATTLAIRDEGRALPAGLVCLSPWTDLTMSGESHQANAAKEVVLHPDNLALWAEKYLGFADPRTPHISPAFADMKNFPPLLIQVGSDEVFLDDAKMVAQRAKSAGVDVTLTIYAGMWHVWQTVGILPEAKRAFEEIGAFSKRIERGFARV
jgi:monoterpene epsilon-lactone hydrolase